MRAELAVTKNGMERFNGLVGGGGGTPSTASVDGYFAGTNIEHDSSGNSAGVLFEELRAARHLDFRPRENSTWRQQGIGAYDFADAGTGEVMPMLHHHINRVKVQFSKLVECESHISCPCVPLLAVLDPRSPGVSSVPSHSRVSSNQHSSLYGSHVPARTGTLDVSKGSPSFCGLLYVAA